MTQKIGGNNTEDRNWGACYRLQQETDIGGHDARDPCNNWLHYTSLLLLSLLEPEGHQRTARPSPTTYVNKAHTLHTKTGKHQCTCSLIKQKWHKFSFTEC